MSYPTHSIVYIDGSNTGITKTHDFNPGRKSWQLYAHHIKTIGDNLIIEASGNDSEIYFKQKNDPLYYKISDFDTSNSIIDISRINPSGTNQNVLTISNNSVQWLDIDGLPNIDSSLDGKALTVSGDYAVWANANSLPTITSSLEGNVLTVSGDIAIWGELPSTQNSHININSDSIKIGQNITSSSNTNNIIIISNSTETENIAHSNSIVLNASSSAINVPNSGFFVNPINSLDSSETLSSVLFYDDTAKEIKYGTIDTTNGGGTTNTSSVTFNNIGTSIGDLSSYYFNYIGSTILIGENFKSYNTTSNSIVPIDLNTHGSNSVIIGYQAQIRGHFNVSIGSNSFAADQSIAIGFGSGGTASSSINSVSIGSNSHVGNTSGSICIGPDSQAHNNNYATAIGLGAHAFGLYSFSIGSMPKANSEKSILFGYGVGWSTPTGMGISSVAIGEWTNAKSLNCMAIGLNSNTNDNHENAITIGQYSNTSRGSISIGYSSYQRPSSQQGDISSITIGYNSGSNSSTSTFVIGQSLVVNNKSDCIYIGKGSNNNNNGNNNIIVLGDQGSIGYIGNSSFTSDDRLKHDELDISNASNIIEQLHPKIYKKTRKMFNQIEINQYDLSGHIRSTTYEPERDTSGNIIYIENTENIGQKGTDWFYEAGLIAQDVYTIDELKEFVQVGDEENVWYIGYNNIFTYNIACTKELIVKSKILENETNLIKNENSLIKDKLNEVLREMGKVEI